MCSQRQPPATSLPPPLYCTRQAHSWSPQLEPTLTASRKKNAEKCTALVDRMSSPHSARRSSMPLNCTRVEAVHRQQAHDTMVGGAWCHVVWCMVPCGMVHGAMWCGAVRCGVTWCGAMRCGMLRCGVLRCGSCGVVCCGAVWCGLVWSVEGWSGGRLWCAVRCGTVEAYRQSIP